MNIFKDILNKILKPSITAASKPARFNKNQNTIERAVNILRAAGIEEDSEFATRVDKVVVALNVYAKLDGVNKTKNNTKTSVEKKASVDKTTVSKTDKKADPAVSKTEPKNEKTKKTKSNAGKVKVVKVSTSKKTVKAAKPVVKASEVTPVPLPNTQSSK